MYKNVLWKKGLVIAIIFLFIGAGVVPSTAIKVMIEKPSTESFDGNTLYVGGSGPGNYSTIQSAIDNASHWDTIFVYSGIYNENIKINKVLNLIGENRETTIIKGHGNSITVNIPQRLVTFQGFTIQNNDDGIGIHTSRVDETIQNNTIKNCNIGIESSYGGVGYIIDNNIIMDNSIYGIYLHSVSGTNNPIITNNIISRNNIGIYSRYTDWITLEDNIISENQKGIFLSKSEGNRIFRNNFLNNTICGIEIEYGSDNVIGENRIVGNSKKGTGIDLYVSGRNTILNNNISNCYVGFNIYSWFTGTSISYNTITLNIVGIYLDDSENIMINNNNFIDNEKGIQMYLSFLIEIHFNNFIRTVHEVSFEHDAWILRQHKEKKIAFFKNNYYDKPRIFNFKVIRGFILVEWTYYQKVPLPCFIIDWNPAKVPNDNTGGYYT